VVSQLQLLLFSGLAFFILLGWLKRTDTITLDVDWLWRRLGPAICRRLDSGSNRAWEALGRRTQQGAERLARTVYRHHGPQGVLARTWPTGSIALWAVFLLGAYLIFYYF
jgi:multicomponent Na+:H+ antiporter subunit D